MIPRDDKKAVHYSVTALFLYTTNEFFHAEKKERHGKACALFL
jgi:hypothetical protein